MQVVEFIWPIPAIAYGPQKTKSQHDDGNATRNAKQWQTVPQTHANETPCLATSTANYKEQN
eukprot:6211648-Amphidinium_carterae.1